MAWELNLIESFEYYDTSTELSKHENINVSGTGVNDVNVSGPDPTYGRYITQFNILDYTQFLHPTATCAHFGMWVYFPTSGSDLDVIIQFWTDVGQTASFQINAADQVQAVSQAGVIATSTETVLAATWHWIEGMIFMDDSGQMIFSLDGVKIIDVATDTKIGASTGLTNLRLSGDSSTLWRTAGIFIRTSNTSSDVDFASMFGPSTFKHIKPTANGSKREWSTTDSPNDYTAIDDSPGWDSPTYVSSNSPGKIVTFGNSPAGLAVGAVIKGVSVKTTVKKPAGGTGRVRSAVYDSPNLAEGSPKGAGTTYEVFEQVYENQPITGSPWTETNFDAIEFGSSYESG